MMKRKLLSEVLISSLVITAMVGLTACGAKNSDEAATNEAAENITEVVPTEVVATVAPTKAVDKNAVYTTKETEVSCTNDGKNIYGAMTVPNGMEGKIPTVIISHGYNGSYKATDALAKYLGEHGIASYRYDFCGGSMYSESDGEMTDMSIVTEKDDLNRVVDFIKTLDYVDTDNLFLFGESQGGCVSAMAAAERVEEIKGLVLLYPALCIPDDAETKYPGLENVPETINFMGGTIGARYYTDLKGLDLYNDIAKYTKDVLIFHGDADALVKLSYSEEAVKVYQSAQLVVMKGAGHGFGSEDSKNSIAQTCEFVQNHLN